TRLLAFDIASELRICVVPAEIQRLRDPISSLQLQRVVTARESGVCIFDDAGVDEAAVWIWRFSCGDRSRDDIERRPFSMNVIGARIPATAECQTVARRPFVHVRRLERVLEPCRRAGN